jgi:hypothetical protein
VVAGDQPTILGGLRPAALAGGPAGPGLRTVFCAEGDWRRAAAEVTQAGDTARVVLVGDGDLDTAAAQVRRFLALDADGRGWPEVGRRDAVIADVQARLPGLRPCGFQSPYEAAAWSVLAQRLRIVQAARLRAELITRYGEDGAFPSPPTLARLDLDLPGRKGEYLRAVAGAALDGLTAVPGGYVDVVSWEAVYATQMGTFCAVRPWSLVSCRAPWPGWELGCKRPETAGASRGVGSVARGPARPDRHGHGPKAAFTDAVRCHRAQ